MNSAFPASKALLLRRLLNPSSSLFLRHLCTESQRAVVPEATVTQAVEFLQKTPEQDWESSQFLQTLIDSSPNVIPHIARRLPSDFEALKFFYSIQINLELQFIPLFSSLFLRVLAIFKEGGRGHGENYWQLYRVFKERKLPFSVMDAAFLMVKLANRQFVDKCVLVYDEIDPSLKDIHVRNLFIKALLKADRVDHARKVLDEMLQRESKVKPNQTSLNLLYKLMQLINADEIVELVLRCCQFSVFPEDSMVASLVKKMCKEGKIVEASGFLDELMKFHAPSLKDILLRNLFISALLQSNCVDHARKVLDEMLQPESEVKPNQVSLNLLYKLMPLINADEIVEMVLLCCQFSVFPEDSMIASLVKKMCKEGKIVEACGFLDELMKFHTPLNANDCFDFVREKLKGKGKGKGKRRMKAYLTEMKEKKEEIYPSNKTVQLIFEKLPELEMVDEAIELFRWFRKGSDSVDVDTYNALIGILCFERRVEELEDVLAQMTASGVKPNATTYRAVVVSLGKKMSLKKVSELVDKLVMEECSPDAIAELICKKWRSKVK